MWLRDEQQVATEDFDLTWGGNAVGVRDGRKENAFGIDRVNALSDRAEGIERGDVKGTRVQDAAAEDEGREIRTCRTE